MAATCGREGVMELTEGECVMVEVDEAPKEREVSIGDAGCVKRDEES